MRIQFEGKEITLEDGTWDWEDVRELARDIGGLAAWCASAIFFGESGGEIRGAARERLVARLDGRYDHLPWAGTLDGITPPDARRWLIPGLQPFGTIPMLGGPPKAGKTKVAVDYTASLLLPGYRFLNHFEPATLTDEEKGRHVWLINAETPAEDFEAALMATGLNDHDEDGYPWSGSLHVEHLEQLGGASTFDLTNPRWFDQWFYRLNSCEACEGEDDTPPIAVIVDGLTAILGGSTERYGQWYAQFRTLLRTLDVPNGLVTGHNTLAGGHLMGGVEAQAGADGLWNYTRRGQDDPGSRRYFSAIPRIGGVPFGPRRVDEVDGRLSVVGPERDEPQAHGDPAPMGPSLADQVLAFVAAANAEREGPSAREIRAGVRGNGAEVSAAKDSLVEAGLLEARTRKMQGGGYAYWVVEMPVPPAPEPTDAEVI